MISTDAARVRRIRRSLMLAAFMTSVAGAAMAATPVGADDKAARIEQLESQFRDMQAELNQLRASGGVSSATVADMQARMDAFNAALTDLKAQNDTNTADIQTLKAPLPVAVTLPNGKPALASSDGRFTANVRATIMFDAGRYFQSTPGPISTDFRRSGGAGTGGFGASGANTNARKLNSGTNFRRARIGVDGKVFGDFDYEAIYEFGGSGAEDAGHIYALDGTWHPNFLKPFKIRLGAFEPNIGLSASLSTSSMILMERPSPAEISRNVAAGDSRSALQVFGNGDIGGGDEGISAYWFGSAAVTGNAIGTVNSASSIGSQPFGEQYAMIGRFAIAPFSGSNWLAHLGFHGQYVFKPNDGGGPNNAGNIVDGRYTATLQDRPELRLDGTRLVSTGAIDARNVWEFGVEGAFMVQNFFVEGEYFQYGINRNVNPCFTTPTVAVATCPATLINPANVPLDNPHFSGWYVEGSWILTGESRVYDRGAAAFNGPTVAYPFNPSAGTWGAWELAARFSSMDLNYEPGSAGLAPLPNSIRGGKQDIITVGLNWYLNQTIRFMFDYQHVHVSRLNPDSSSSGSFSAPVGAQVGQTYDTIAVRSQLAF